MMPVTELRGAIPIGIAMNLDPLGVYAASVIGSSVISIPLTLTFRHILSFIRGISFLKNISKKIDNKIEACTYFSIYKLTICHFTSLCSY